MNPLVATFLLGPAVLAAPYRGTLDLSDRSELRGGDFGLPSDPALNAETVPSIALFLATRQSALNLTYAPRLALTHAPTLDSANGPLACRRATRCLRGYDTAVMERARQP